MRLDHAGRLLYSMAACRAGLRRGCRARAAPDNVGRFPDRAECTRQLFRLCHTPASTVSAFLQCGQSMPSALGSEVEGWWPASAEAAGGQSVPPAPDSEVESWWPASAEAAGGQSMPSALCSKVEGWWSASAGAAGALD